MKLAPIILFVYNRPGHTRRTLEALAQNELADSSDLYIFCDGIKDAHSKENINAIMEVRRICKAQQWPSKLIIHEQEKNIGLSQSVINGIGEVLKTHESVIVLEDDIVTQKYFMQFMNQALNLYADDSKVFGVSGYKYPTSANIDVDSYFLPIACSWGYGIWRRSWEKISFNGDDLLSKIEKRSLKKKMNFGKYPFYEMLQDQVEEKVDSWAIRFYASMFLEQGIFLFPNVSLVENIGFDNSGTHCTEDSFFGKSIDLSRELVLQKLPTKLDPSIVKGTRKEFERNSNKAKTSKVDVLVRKVKSKINRFLSIL